MLFLHVSIKKGDVYDPDAHPGVPHSIAAGGRLNFEGCQTLTIAEQKLLSIYNSDVTRLRKQCLPRLLCFFVKSIMIFAEV
ncbi:protein of unknown function [Enterobacter cancerogenus]|nr:protein of unknown function [Enterobacter cancerogenus]